MWTGECWRGKRVILRCLHGLGDTIQFIRYASWLRADCKWLGVQTHPQLVTLLRGVPGVDEVMSWETDGSEFGWELQIEINELPRIARTNLRTIPSSVPYIFIPRAAIDRMSGHIGESRLRTVGLCWQSGDWDRARTVSISELAALVEAPGVRLYSLQKGVPAPDGVSELEAFATDVQDTAAAILNLDLVISVDTMTAHLAGALGVPVWILLPARADWRWMLERDDSPWYPTARLFRQTKQGAWSDVIQDVKAALTNWSERK